MANSSSGELERLRGGPSRTAVVARLGLATWMFGNLYEAIVDVPRLVSEARPAGGRPVLAPGSPVRYYAPTLLPTFAAATARSIQVWRAGGRRRAAVGAAALATAAGLTAYLVPTVNLPLLGDGAHASAARRRRLLGTWHRLNGVRLAALAVAWWSMRSPG